MIAADLVPPWDVTDQELLFVLDRAPLRKIRLLMDAQNRLNQHRFHGHPAGTLRFLKMRAIGLECTRHCRPLWQAWALLVPVDPDIAILYGEIIPLGNILLGTADFNQLPLGRKVSHENTLDARHPSRLPQYE